MAWFILAKSVARTLTLTKSSKQINTNNKLSHIYIYKIYSKTTQHNIYTHPGWPQNNCDDDGGSGVMCDICSDDGKCQRRKKNQNGKTNR